MPTSVSEPNSEQERIEIWREHILLEAGYPKLPARRLALNIDVDLHFAVRLVKQGCPPYVAERILS